LRAAELDELGRLYQAAANDLATAQREFPGQEVALYLNQLVGDAHSLVYRGGPLRGQQLIGFFRRGFPALYRSFLPYTTVAFLLFLFTAVVAFFVVSVQPDAIFVIEGEGIAPLVSEVEAGKLWLDIEPAARATAAGLIMTNNIQVMINTFAGGLTAGLFTLYIIAVNGLHLGAIFGLLAYHGLTRGLAEFIVGHGGIELSVIFLAQPGQGAHPAHAAGGAADSWLRAPAHSGRPHRRLSQPEQRPLAGQGRRGGDHTGGPPSLLAARRAGGNPRCIKQGLRGLRSQPVGTHGVRPDK
jgi:hypothetical protein